jgi:hypothetical protein
MSCLFSLTGQNPSAPEPDYEFVSGTIAELPAGKIVVNRAGLGKPELRTFLITEETKIEGRLRQGARVTVGFKPSEFGDVAVRIIVRNQSPSEKK